MKSVLWVTDTTRSSPAGGKHLVTAEWLDSITRTVGAPEVVHVQAKRRDLLRGALLPVGLPGLWSSTILDSLRVAKSLKRVTPGHRPRVAIVDHFRLAWALPLVRRRFDCPVLLLEHNVETVARRSYLSHASFAGRISAAAELPSMSFWERRLVRAFDGVIALSPVDAEYLRATWGCDNVAVVPPALEDAMSWTATRQSVGPPHSNKTLLYVGSFDYRAKLANAKWFLSKVAPALAQKHGDLTVQIVGHGSRRLLTEPWARAPWLLVEGEVDDLTPYYDRAMAAIVPEPVGGGFKTKILEAVRRGVPVIATRDCLEPVGLAPGRECFCADTPDQWLSAVSSLIANRELGDAVAAAAARFVREEFSRVSFDRRVRSLLMSFPEDAAARG